MAEHSDQGPDLRGKSLLIFDDGLRSLAGHWYEYDRATAELHLQRGASVTLICHRAFSHRDALEVAGAAFAQLRSSQARPAGTPLSISRATIFGLIVETIAAERKTARSTLRRSPANCPPRTSPVAKAASTSKS